MAISHVAVALGSEAVPYVQERGAILHVVVNSAEVERLWRLPLKTVRPSAQVQHISDLA